MTRFFRPHRPFPLLRPAWSSAIKLVHLTLWLILLLFALPAQAVRLAQGEAGQVAILPLYNTLGGLDTLIKISNGPEYSAVRVQFRGPDGEATETLNVYLAPDEAWQAAVSMGPEGPRLATADTSCVLVTSTGFSPVSALQSDLSLSASFGYAEVLLMGQVEDLEIQSDISDRSCQALAGAFGSGPFLGIWGGGQANTGISAPTDSLHIHYQLIDVERGTRYGLDAVHLAQFRDQPFHVPPMESFGLADAHDDGTDIGETRSLVCDAECTVETWADPRDAVASVLLAEARRVDYVVNPDIGASSSFVLLNPMHPYYAEGEIPEPEARLYVTDSEAGFVSPFVCLAPPPPNTLCPPASPLTQPEALSAFTLKVDEPGMVVTKPVPILEISGLYPIAQDFFDSVPIDALISGSAYVLFPSFGLASLTSNDGTEYSGLPSIVVGFTEFINGELTSADGGSVRANYGSAAFGAKADSVIAQ